MMVSLIKTISRVLSGILAFPILIAAFPVILVSKALTYIGFALVDWSVFGSFEDD